MVCATSSRGELKVTARWSSVMMKPTWWFSVQCRWGLFGGASDAGGSGPSDGDGTAAELQPESERSDVARRRRQTATALWRSLWRSREYQPAFTFGPPASISESRLPLTLLGRCARSSQTPPPTPPLLQGRARRWHHAVFFLLLQSRPPWGCKGGWPNTTANAFVSTPFIACATCVCVRAIACARPVVFMTVCLQRLTTVLLFPRRWC